MKRSGNYHTRQYISINNYFASLKGAHVTAAQIAGHFENADLPVGRTTVYRQLDRMTKSGQIRKYTTDGISGACYQYIEAEKTCHEHFHLKCEGCGDLLHIQCETMDEIQEHIFSRHDFEVNALKTVLYGKCGACMGINGHE